MEDKRISSLGNKIDYLRFLHGDISKKNFCKESGISTSTLNNIENGITPTLDTLVKIADYFDVTVDYLLDRTDIPGPIYKDIDALHLSEGGRYVLESNDIYGNIMSHLLENENFRKLVRQIDDYFHNEGLEASAINNLLADKTIIGINEIERNNSDSDTNNKNSTLLDEQIIDRLEGMKTDYEKDKLDSFARKLSDILSEVKSSYGVDEKKRQRMQKLTVSINDIAEDMTRSAALTQRISVDTYVSTCMDVFKKRQILGDNSLTYDYLEKAFILMMKD